MGSLLLLLPELKLSTNLISINQILTIMSNSLKHHSQYLLTKCNNDLELAKKITLNKAIQDSIECNDDSLDRQAEIWHHLKHNKAS